MRNQKRPEKFCTYNEVTIFNVGFRFFRGEVNFDEILVTILQKSMMSLSKLVRVKGTNMLAFMRLKSKIIGY